MDDPNAQGNAQRSKAKNAPSARLDPVLRVRRAQRGIEQTRTQEAAAAARECELRADALSKEIARLASEMQANKRPGRLNVKALQQMDELTELLNRQRTELLDEADKANDVLDECRIELDRANQNVRTVERLKEIQANERTLQRKRRDAA